MKKYRVNVNGTAYEVELEEMTGAMPTASAPVSAAPAAPVDSASGGENVTAPMPGTIVSININPGTMAKRGEVLMILEAMKMENEILSETDGTVTKLFVKKGDSVLEGADIASIA